MTSLLLYPAKSLSGRRRRFLFLGIAVAFGFFVMTLTMGLTEGLLHAVRSKGAFYFSGDVTVSMVSGGNSYAGLDSPYLHAVAGKSIPAASLALRSVYYTGDAQLFHSGASVRQRRLVGIDWALERAQFRTMYFASGGVPEDEGDDAILISDVAARRLGAGLGDTITLAASGAGGRNTAPFIVRGIFKDASLFGYASYVSRKALNALLSQDAGFATEFAVFLPAGQNVEAAARSLQAGIAAERPAFPVAYTREEQYSFLNQPRSGDKFLVCTLDAHLSEIKQMLDAISIACYSLLAVFLAIVLLGISNTYRVVVYQRAAEIGMMRALGMKAWQAVGLVVEEAGLLGLAASLLGLALGILALWGVSTVDLSGYTSMSMFLERGHIAWALDPGAIVLVLAIVSFAIFSAAWFPARAAARISPVEAMRSDE
jgi:ABC-type transport system, involved in lipoprotein release, permease component